VALQHRIGASRGIGGPLTQAELTLAANGVDFFDVQIIGGVTVPTSITPNGLTPYPGNPYTNGAAGATGCPGGHAGHARRGHLELLTGYDVTTTLDACGCTDWAGVTLPYRPCKTLNPNWMSYTIMFCPDGVSVPAD
jgi:hypothetical protein